MNVAYSENTKKQAKFHAAKTVSKKEEANFVWDKKRRQNVKPTRRGQKGRPTF